MARGVRAMSAAGPAGQVLANAPDAERSGEVPGVAGFCLAIGPVRFPLILQIVVLGLALAHLGTARASAAWPGALTASLAELFHLNLEGNVPALFSAALWLLAAVLAYRASGVLRARGDAKAAAWTGLALLFAYLGVDEGAALHERVGVVIKAHIPLTGFFYYGWVLAGIAFLCLMSLLFLPLMLRLRPGFALRFVASGAVFVSGALGAEMLGAAVESGWLADFPLGLTWTRIVIIEETLEMTGLVLLTHTLLAVLSTRGLPYR